MRNHLCKKGTLKCGGEDAEKIPTANKESIKCRGEDAEKIPTANKKSLNAEGKLNKIYIHKPEI